LLSLVALVLTLFIGQVVAFRAARLALVDSDLIVGVIGATARLHH
jgi:hypothetical protein